MPIETWFPLAIYYTDLPDAAVHQENLIQAVQLLENEAQTRRASVDSAWTGDIHGVEQIHDDSRFAWIIGQLEIHILEYIKILGINVQQIDAYFQRSWPVISRKAQRVSDHRHLNAHISAVYYVAVPKSGDAGSIVFYNDAIPNEISPGLGSAHTEGYQESNPLNYGSAKYPPIEGRLVIFPAKQRHAVEPNQTNELRISLAFDICLSSTATGNPGLHEFLTPPPTQWRSFQHNQHN